MSPSISNWSEDRIDKLKALWAEGFTCSQIGLQLGLSRNSIIGKATRLGLSGRTPGRTVNVEKRKPSLVAERKPPRLDIVNAAPTVETPPELGAPNDFLTGAVCKFIAADVSVPGWKMCGQPVQLGRSWCPFHRSRVVDGTATSRANRKAEAKSIDAQQDSAARRMGLG